MKTPKCLLMLACVGAVSASFATGLPIDGLQAHFRANHAGRAPETVNPHLRGRIAESGKYESLHPRFPKAFEFMRRPDLPSLPVGRYEIDGTNCWAIIMDTALRPFAATNQYEVHKAFIDIQSPISGPETIGVVESNPSMFGNFNYEKDFALFNSGGKPWNLVPGEFAVFFPDKGAHAPGLSVGSTNAIRKLVIKVRK